MHVFRRVHVLREAIYACCLCTKFLTSARFMHDFLASFHSVVHNFSLNGRRYACTLGVLLDRKRFVSVGRLTWGGGAPQKSIYPLFLSEPPKCRLISVLWEEKGFERPSAGDNFTVFGNQASESPLYPPLCARLTPFMHVLCIKKKKYVRSNLCICLCTKSPNMLKTMHAYWAKAYF